jgi:hypothetical protein
MDDRVIKEPSELDGFEIIELDNRLDLAVDFVGLSDANGNCPTCNMGCIAGCDNNCDGANCVVGCGGGC